MGARLLHRRTDGVGWEETEPSALSSGEGPHISSLSTLSPGGSASPLWVHPCSLRTAFFLLVLTSSPRDHHCPTLPFQDQDQICYLPPSCPHPCVGVVAGPAPVIP